LLRASGDEGEKLLPYGLLDQLAVGRHGEGSVLGAGADLLAMLGAARDRPGQPVVLLVDDLHWADVESAGALLAPLPSGGRRTSRRRQRAALVARTTRARLGVPKQLAAAPMV
jgi:hypothetical protein